MCGASKRDVAQWALKQAERQRFTDLIRAARGLPEHPPAVEPKPDTPGG